MERLKMKNMASKVSNFYRKMESKALVTMRSSKLKERMKSKGALNTVEVLAILVVLLIITYPLYKDLMSNFLGSAKTWFTTQQNGIFK